MFADNFIKVIDDLAKRFGVAIDWSEKNLLPKITELGQRIVKL